MKKSAAKLRFSVLMLAGLMLLSVCGNTVSAEIAPPPESRQIGAACFICLNNHQMIYEKNADTRLYPASTVKMMTGLLICRYCSDRLDDEITLTSAMLSGVTGRSMHLSVGETVNIRDLLYALLCGCYNDAAYALAVVASGSVAGFVEEMNREAQRLGAFNTVYTNPTGMHDDAMVTTLRDTAIIAREAAKNVLFMSVCSAQSYTFSTPGQDGERTIYNRNALLSDTSQIYRNGWCHGMNAGMTDEGGWCVVTLYERDGVSLLGVVMQGADVPSGENIPAYTYMNSLLTWARNNYGLIEVLPAGSKVDSVKVGMTGLSSSKTDLITKTGLCLYLPRDVLTDELTISWSLTGKWENGNLTAPVSQGETVGTVTVHYGTSDSTVGTAPLTVSDSFESNGFMEFMIGFRSYLGSRPFVITVCVFLLSLFLYIRLVRKSGGRYRPQTWKKRKPVRRNPFGRHMR